MSTTPEDREQSNTLIEGQTFEGRYQIISVLGRGGVGVVYKARHLHMDKLVAIKTLLPTVVSNDPESFQRFQHEARTASSLDHVNVITIFDFGKTASGLVYLVMEYLGDLTLEGLLIAEERLDLERFLRLAVQTCEALQHAHKNGIVHRDIKPSNIMLTKNRDGENIVKVVDFGLAKLTAIESAQNLTKTGAILGTPLYMSPEQCRGLALDSRSDIYSLACVFYTALTGAVPIRGATALDTLYQHTVVKPQAFAVVCPGITFPARLEQVIFKALEKNPDDRQQTMLELRNAISDAIFDRSNGDSDLKISASANLAHSLAAVLPPVQSDDQSKTVDLHGGPVEKITNSSIANAVTAPGAATAATAANAATAATAATAANAANAATAATALSSPFSAPHNQQRRFLLFSAVAGVVVLIGLAIASLPILSRKEPQAISAPADHLSPTSPVMPSQPIKPASSAPVISVARVAVQPEKRVFTAVNSPVVQRKEPRIVEPVKPVARQSEIKKPVHAVVDERALLIKQLAQTQAAAHDLMLQKHWALAESTYGQCLNMQKKLHGGADYHVFPTLSLIIETQLLQNKGVKTNANLMLALHIFDRQKNEVLNTVEARKGALNIWRSLARACMLNGKQGDDVSLYKWAAVFYELCRKSWQEPTDSRAYRQLNFDYIQALELSGNISKAAAIRHECGLPAAIEKPDRRAIPTPVAGPRPEGRRKPEVRRAGRMVIRSYR
ncbi:MAG: serine/threonine protein kinase [Cyanobacteria bacterium REEB67]|nr:serine/threonine protein kinase [Cyanobacteria bacterium REEB67]